MYQMYLQRKMHDPRPDSPPPEPPLPRLPVAPILPPPASPGRRIHPSLYAVALDADGCCCTTPRCPRGHRAAVTPYMHGRSSHFSIGEPGSELDDSPYKSAMGPSGRGSTRYSDVSDCRSRTSWGGGRWINTWKRGARRMLRRMTTERTVESQLWLRPQVA